jgi:hypothetical protein
MKATCPYCQAEFDNTHVCQESEKNNYYFQQGKNLCPEEVKEMRKSDEEWAKTGMKNPWECKD